MRFLLFGHPVVKIILRIQQLYRLKSVILLLFWWRLVFDLTFLQLLCYRIQFLQKLFWIQHLSVVMDKRTCVLDLSVSLNGLVLSILPKFLMRMFLFQFLKVRKKLQLNNKRRPRKITNDGVNISIDSSFNTRLQRLSHRCYYKSKIIELKHKLQLYILSNKYNKFKYNHSSLCSPTSLQK